MIMFDLQTKLTLMIMLDLNKTDLDDYVTVDIYKTDLVDNV